MDEQAVRSRALGIMLMQSSCLSSSQLGDFSGLISSVGATAGDTAFKL